MNTTDLSSGREIDRALLELTRALADRELARTRIIRALKVLKGPARRAGIHKALDAGISPTELAAGLGISRGRLYQLTDKKETR